MPRITIFGGPETEIADTVEEAEEIGRRLSDRGYLVKYKHKGKTMESLEELRSLKDDDED